MSGQKLRDASGEIGDETEFIEKMRLKPRRSTTAFLDFGCIF
jgi:hypothetical protein